MNIRPTLFERVAKVLIDAREHAVRRRIRQHLRGLSDRQLEDMGFSRVLLEQGPKAWPWRLAEEPDGGSNLAAALRASKAEPAIAPADYVLGAGGQTGYPADSDDRLAA